MSLRSRSEDRNPSLLLYKYTFRTPYIYRAVRGRDEPKQPDHAFGQPCRSIQASHVSNEVWIGPSEGLSKIETSSRCVLLSTEAPYHRILQYTVF